MQPWSKDIRSEYTYNMFYWNYTLVSHNKLYAVDPVAERFECPSHVISTRRDYSSSEVLWLDLLQLSISPPPSYHESHVLWSDLSRQSKIVFSLHVIWPESASHA